MGNQPGGDPASPPSPHDLTLITTKDQTSYSTSADLTVLCARRFLGRQDWASLCPVFPSAPGPAPNNPARLPVLVPDSMADRIANLAVFPYR